MNEYIKHLIAAEKERGEAEWKEFYREQEARFNDMDQAPNVRKKKKTVEDK